MWGARLGAASTPACWPLALAACSAVHASFSTCALRRAGQKRGRPAAEAAGAALPPVGGDKHPATLVESGSPSDMPLLQGGWGAPLHARSCR